MFLKNRNIILKIKLSKDTDYAALNKANTFDTEICTGLSITNSIVASKIHDKRDGFNFEIYCLFSFPIP